MKKYLYLMVVAVFYACSSAPTKKIYDFEGLNSENLYKLQNLSTDDPEYLVVASQAIDDLRFVSESSLRSKNSILALKAASVGVALFPFRKDLVDLKNNAIKVNVEVTKKMAESGQVTCSQIQERVDFLKQLAPDVVIGSLSGNCSIKLRDYSPLKDYISVLRVDDESQTATIEKNYSTEFDKTLNEIVERKNFMENAPLPFYELLNNSLAYLKKMKWVYEDIKIVPETVKSKDLFYVSYEPKLLIEGEEFEYKDLRRYYDGASFLVQLAMTPLVLGLNWLIFPTYVGTTPRDEFCNGIRQIVDLELKDEAYKHNAYKQYQVNCDCDKGRCNSSFYTTKEVAGTRYYFFAEWVPRLAVMERVLHFSDGRVEKQRYLQKYPPENSSKHYRTEHRLSPYVPDFKSKRNNDYAFVSDLEYMYFHLMSEEFTYDFNEHKKNLNNLLSEKSQHIRGTSTNGVNKLVKVEMSIDQRATFLVNTRLWLDWNMSKDYKSALSSVLSHWQEIAYTTLDDVKNWK